MEAESRRHGERVRAISDTLRSARRGARVPLGLSKDTSNLFRIRSRQNKNWLDLDGFGHVLEINLDQGVLDAEGMTTYEKLVDSTLPLGVMPAVVPQLKTITIGGAAAGVGIEATSFRRGLVHDTLLEIEVLLPGGEIVVCMPDNEHADLFYGFPNSYGTLGYALRLKARTQPVRHCVKVEHLRFDRSGPFFAELVAQCARDADFVDAVAFGPRELVLNVGRFADESPWLSDYSFERIYYRSLLGKPVDYLSTLDYLWRWDTDWFWCSRNLGAQNPWLRRLYGRRRLNSRTYARLMRWNDRWGVTRAWDRLRGLHPESVIQDVDLPIARAEEFLEFLFREIGIAPVWICPIRPAEPGRAFTLYPLAPGTRYVNFGFWDTVRAPETHPPGHFNRLIERTVIEFGGIKSLYSDSYFTHDEFAQAYRMDRYRTLKSKYDPEGQSLDLYDKCVRRA